MTAPDKIEILEKRWHENPSGLVFTPLAEAYRRAGQTARALEVLEAGLAHHPDHIPGLIVLGRCHLDAANPLEAETVFDRVLLEDPANAIALRGLAEVYERTDRVALAIERLRFLLEVEQSDPDVRRHLEQLQRRPAPETLAEPPSEPEVPDMPPGLPPEPPFEEDLPRPSEAAAPESPEEPGPAGAPDVEPEPELVVTESMAELFLRQGHRELALAVYRQLAERTPHAPHLVRAIADLSPAEPVGAADPGPAAPAPVERPSRAARTTGGRSVEEYLRGVLQSPPPVSRAAAFPPPAVSGEPAYPVTEPLSLGAVFGDDPPPPPSGTGIPVDEPPAGEREPSYDEFFGAGASREESPEGEDLQQFNEWLRGLTR